MASRKDVLPRDIARERARVSDRLRAASQKLKALKKRCRQDLKKRPCTIRQQQVALCLLSENKQDRPVLAACVLPDGRRSRSGPLQRGDNDDSTSIVGSAQILQGVGDCNLGVSP